MKSLLDSLTPGQQLKFLSTKGKDGKTAVQWAPADVCRDMDKMLKNYMREADFEVNYGKFALFSLLAGFGIRKLWQFRVVTPNSKYIFY